jgi:very-short-patch-repair endonuclease
MYKYSEIGIINEIAEYESSLEKEEYKLLRLTKIKINKSPKKLTKEIIEEINSELSNE